MKKLLAISFTLILNSHILAQPKADSLSVKFVATWNEMHFELNKNYVSKNQDTLQLTSLKFYLSNLKIEFENDTFYTDDKTILINFEDLRSVKIPLLNKGKKIKAISFSIGVDSLSSVSGALEGDLDPSKGMYWAWQSGYINMKMEGTSSSCKTRKNSFYFHIGGYLDPNYALRKVKLIPKSDKIEIEINLATFFDGITLSNTNSIMIPGKQAMELADLSVKMFICK